MRKRPGANAEPVRIDWTSVPTVQVDRLVWERTADQQARFLLATTELSADTLSDEALPAAEKDQGSVERGVRFFKDPLFLASSVFVKKPGRLIALSFLLGLCFLVSRLAEHRLRQRVQERDYTISTRINNPTARPTMRRVFQCFEGIELLPLRRGSTFQTRIGRLQPLHQTILRVLGPPSRPFSFFLMRNCGMWGGSSTAR
jgi:hypothetical protein